jgi:hypothetical protein
LLRYSYDQGVWQDKQHHTFSLPSVTSTRRY